MTPELCWLVMVSAAVLSCLALFWVCKCSCNGMLCQASTRLAHYAAVPDVSSHQLQILLARAVLCCAVVYCVLCHIMLIAAVFAARPTRTMPCYVLS